MSWRTLPGPLDNALNAGVTKRRWLVYMGYSPEVRIYSGQRDVVWDNQLWGAAGLDVSGPTQEKSGVLKATIQIVDENWLFSALFLGSQGVNGIVCRVYYYDDDWVLLIDGELDGADIAGNRATVTVRQERVLLSQAPRLLIAPPTFNHIIQAGTVVTWEGERYVIERER